MTDQQIIDTYALRKMTIREISAVSGRSYESVRRLLVAAGFHYTHATKLKI